MENIVLIDLSQKKTFDDVFKLIKDSGLTEVEGHPVSVTEEDNQKGIIYNEILYKLSTRERSNKLKEFKFGNNGASWFSMLREEGKGNYSNEGWNELIANLTKQFHREFSVFEYETKGRSRDDKNQDHEVMKEVLKKFFPKLNLRIQANTAFAKRDIYGAVLKLDVTDGPKEPKSILCKVFFKKVGSTLIPLSSNEAMMINASFASSVLNDNETELEKVDSITVENVTNDVTNALDRLFTEGDFDRNFIFQHEDKENEEDSDRALIKKIVDDSPKWDIAEIFVRNVSVLSIVHSRWEETAYYVVDDDNYSVLKFEIGVGGVLSLKCIACEDEEYLIENDKIFNEATNTEIDYKTLLKRKDVDLKNTAFERHLCEYVSCRTSDPVDCNKRVCKNMVDEDGKCKNCHRADVFYQLSDEKMLIKDMRFDSFKNELSDAENLRRCGCCGRFFSNGMIDNYCSMCSDFLNDYPDEIKPNKKTYHRYARLLPFSKRLRFVKRRAVEDDEIVLIRLGKKIYKVDKLAEMYKIKAQKLNVKDRVKEENNED